MSEAVVDDIVAVLPPLLQSLEALGFIARHLNPPQFDAVMEAAGTPDQALQAVRPRLADWPEGFAHLRTPLETASDAAIAAFEGLRAVQHGNGDLIAVFRALRYAPRAQEALYPLTAKLPPVSNFFIDPPLRADADLRLAAGDGAAWRQRQWPRFPVELAARGAQPWCDPGRTHRDRRHEQKHLGIDGRRHRHPEPRAHSRFRASTLEHRSPPAAADRDERRRHVLLRHRAGERFALHPSCANCSDLPSTDGGNGRCGKAARASHPCRARPARLDVSGASGAADARVAVGGRRRCDLPGA